MSPHFIRTLLALLALFAGSAAHASIPAFEGYAAASDAELDKMRGGFEVNLNGMQLLLAFSLERLTYINGELVSSMKLTPLQLILPTASPTAGTPVATTAPAPSAGTPAAAAPVSTTGTPMAAAPAPASTSGGNSTPSSANPAQTAQAGTVQIVQSVTTPTAAVSTQLVNNQGIINLVQNGAGNVFTLPQALSSLNTVIQNTVNDQVIRNLTVLNATLSLRSAAAAMQLGAALNHAVATSVR